MIWVLILVYLYSVCVRKKCHESLLILIGYIEVEPMCNKCRRTYMNFVVKLCRLAILVVGLSFLNHQDLIVGVNYLENITF